MQNNSDIYHGLEAHNLLIKPENQGALPLVKEFLQVPISRIQMGISPQETVFINGVKIEVAGDPFQMSIVTNEGKKIKLDSIASAAYQILDYLRLSNPDDLSWEYRDYKIFKVGQEGLDRKIYELRKGTAKPIRLTVAVGETEDPEAIMRKVNNMVDRIRGT